MRHTTLEILEGRSPIVSVSGSFVDIHYDIDYSLLEWLSIFSKVINCSLGAEGNEERTVTEVIEIVSDRWNVQ